MRQSDDLRLGLDGCGSTEIAFRTSFGQQTVEHGSVHPGCPFTVFSLRFREVPIGQPDYLAFVMRSFQDDQKRVEGNLFALVLPGH